MQAYYNNAARWRSNEYKLPPISVPIPVQSSPESNCFGLALMAVAAAAAAVGVSRLSTPAVYPSNPGRGAPPCTPFLRPPARAISSASSIFSGERLSAPAVAVRRRGSRVPVVVRPRAVSDSQSSQTCLDPDASRVSFFSRFVIWF